MIEIVVKCVGCDECGRTVGRRRTLRFDAHLVALPLSDAIQIPPDWRTVWRNERSMLMCPTCLRADDARQRLGGRP